MIDIRLLRENADTLVTALARRGVTQEEVEGLRRLDEERRMLITAGDDLRAEQKQRSREIGAAAPEERQALIDQVKAVSARLDELEPAQAEAQARLERALAVIPNLPHPDAPDGSSEEDAVELFTFGERPTFDFDPRDHLEIGEALGIIDVDRAVKVAGSRFAFLLGQAAMLELALIRFAMDRIAGEGFTPTITPSLSRSDALYGTAFLPTGTDQLYRVAGADDEPALYLVGTSEVPLAGMHLDEILDPDELPLRYGGFSSCYRREAGTYGKDTRGIFRMHQFEKVEMFSFVLPEQSEAEHERMRGIEVGLFTDLELHGRVVDIAVGDLGASAARKYDCEVWLPGQQRYRELTSTSNCTDYQARRLRCRYRTEDGGTAMVHTLNGTAIAVPRTIIALLETHQRADGTVAIPDALQPHFGGDHIAGRAGATA